MAVIASWLSGFNSHSDASNGEPVRDRNERAVPYVEGVVDAETAEMTALEPVTDDELTALALAADPDVEVGDDAVSVWELAEPEADDDLLPSSYMPSPMAGRRLLHGWRRWVVLLVIVSFLLIDAYGLCSTYGWVGFG